MTQSDIIKLFRDVNAFAVPSGEQIILKKGELVRITQALGGSYTLSIHGNLVQIAGEDADAIGREPQRSQFGDLGKSTSPINKELVMNQLKSCYDPEIPINIVDLGLIYDCHLTKSVADEGTDVHIKMTLTAPGCGMGGVIAADAERKVRAIPGVKDVKVELVWEPLWNRDMMTEAARLQLGLM
ncbi:MAG: putative Fe-S cluster assembly protein SufT [Candidatus Marinimicrobia bacterium]|nr:putative Fe-S cluster assembly protein SufT [Candidatus Neomarinimicrobiota bacterium]MBL7059507.1 putative Fe-S cluster assembly protein SufT [Candidatus Neomarinimicrobiota bacterium]